MTAYFGYVESEAKVQARKQRILKRLPPMSRKDWQSLPDAVKVFIPWNEARVAKVIELPNREEVDSAVEYFLRVS